MARLVQIFGIESDSDVTEENARADEPVTKRSTAGGLQMPGDYGVYPPAGYRSHCSPARKASEPNEAESSRVHASLAASIILVQRKRAPRTPEIDRDSCEK